MWTRAIVGVRDAAPGDALLASPLADAPEAFVRFVGVILPATRWHRSLSSVWSRPTRRSGVRLLAAVSESRGSGRAVVAAGVGGGRCGIREGRVGVSDAALAVSSGDSERLPALVRFDAGVDEPGSEDGPRPIEQAAADDRGVVQILPRAGIRVRWPCRRCCRDLCVFVVLGPRQCCESLTCDSLRRELCGVGGPVWRTATQCGKSATTLTKLLAS